MRLRKAVLELVAVRDSMRAWMSFLALSLVVISVWALRRCEPCYGEVHGV